MRKQLITAGVLTLAAGVYGQATQPSTRPAATQPTSRPASYTTDAQASARMREHAALLALIQPQLDAIDHAIIRVRRAIRDKNDKIATYAEMKTRTADGERSRKRNIANLTDELVMNAKELAAFQEQRQALLRSTWPATTQP